MKKQNIQISVDGITSLSPEDIWPDGDAPENPSVDDVIKAIKDDCYSAEELFNKWHLSVYVWVHANRETKEVKF